MNRRSADEVNRSPAVNGKLTWRCEECDREWTEPEDPTYDRTTDGSNWPVLCGPCWQKYRTPKKDP